MMKGINNTWHVWFIFSACGFQSDNVYSNILLPAEDDGGKEIIREAEDVDYASVQFKQQKQNR